MKIITVLFFLFFTSLQAVEISFTSFRQQEKVLTLSAFKNLYKKRQNIHRNLRQVLKHSRAKNLQKNQLLFFQAKDSQLEASSVFLLADLPCTQDCGTTTDADISIPNLDGTNSDMVTDDIVQDSNIRQNITSPWARK